MQILINSALANARNNLGIDGTFFIKEIRVDQGPMLKRWMPRAFGRATMIQRKTSHVTLVLEVKEPRKIEKKEEKKEEVEEVKKEERKEMPEIEIEKSKKPKILKALPKMKKIFRRKSA